MIDGDDDEFDWLEHPVAEQVLALLEQAQTVGQRAMDAYRDDEELSDRLGAEADALEAEADRLVEQADLVDGLNGELIGSYNAWGTEQIELDQAINGAGRLADLKATLAKADEGQG